MQGGLCRLAGLVDEVLGEHRMGAQHALEIGRRIVEFDGDDLPEDHPGLTLVGEDGALEIAQIVVAHIGPSLAGPPLSGEQTGRVLKKCSARGAVQSMRDSYRDRNRLGAEPSGQSVAPSGRWAAMILTRLSRPSKSFGFVV